MTKEYKIPFRNDFLEQLAKDLYEVESGVQGLLFTENQTLIKAAEIVEKLRAAL